jgi:hypothetical protein
LAGLFTFEDTFEIVMVKKPLEAPFQFQLSVQLLRAELLVVLLKILKLKIPCLNVGGFNCDLNCSLSSASIRASLLYGIFGDDFKVQEKSTRFTYTSSCTSNLDHVVSYNLDILYAEVFSEFQISDDLSIASSFKQEASRVHRLILFPGIMVYLSRLENNRHISVH